MKLIGFREIQLDKKSVWKALNDPEILKKTIPGCQEFKKNSETEFTATATNKIGPFNASFTGDIELTDLDPPNSYKIIGSGNSLVGFATGEASVKLEDSNEGTKLTYVVEANVGGKIAQVGSRLIDMTAKKMADIFFGKFSELISPKTETDEIKKTVEDKISREKKPVKKLLIFVAAVIIIGIIAYSLS